MQMRRRFADLPASVEDRVRSAAPEQIDLWAERVLFAASLEELLGED